MFFDSDMLICFLILIASCVNIMTAKSQITCFCNESSQTFSSCKKFIPISVNRNLAFGNN